MKESLNNIRKSFLDYFEKNNHKKISSSSLIPHNDPSMMFVNSGMVQFKNIFTGTEIRDYTRATTAQKCVRAGGKHNDLDNVGYTARHHTFFEMLGNFSFGDYFKEEAIFYAYDFLVNVIGLNKNKLYFTVYHNDDESANFWKKLSGFSDDRIIRIATSDNFWSMGDTGPCGPCSEIFYDHGENIFGGLPGTKDQDGDRYIEIWNLVFMQYEQMKDGTMKDLPKKSIDTGMGLERLAAVIQNVHDNYDIDLFKEIIEYSQYLTKTTSNDSFKFSHRIIADHLRSSSFLIADGIMPSNEGKGYVLRRILRRAMRHCHALDPKEPLLYKIFPKLVELMGSHYLELKRAEKFITDILKQEEERFKITLDKGLKLLESESVSLFSGNKLDGAVAFKLYDTYGFPLDLTEDILKKKNITVDTESFNKHMNDQKERARKNWVGSGEEQIESLWFDFYTENGATEFLGYSSTKSTGKIIGIIKDSEFKKEYSNSDKVMIITNQTPFYGESGGQLGDVGIIYKDNFLAKVIDTKKYLGSLIVHLCVIEKGEISLDETVNLEIDETYRNQLRSNHSATHLLHSALRKLLGEHVTQKGSLVASDKLRFDFSHPKSLSKDEINEIENLVNSEIIKNSDVETCLMNTEDAVNGGAMALFGEKYDSEVRVVSMGHEQDFTKYSFELCGGTHVSKTGDIGLFKIVSESAIASGIRRIEALTGLTALNYINDIESKLKNSINLLKTTKDEFEEKLESLISNYKELEKEISNLRISSILYDKKSLEEKSQQIGEIKLFIKQLNLIDTKSMRSAIQSMQKLSNSQIILYLSKFSDKNHIIISVSNDISSNYSAKDIIKYISENLEISEGGGSEIVAQTSTDKQISLNKIEKVLQLYLSKN